MKDKSKKHYYGHRERLKERFMKAPSLVPDYELLEIFLTFVIPRKDVKPIAKDILDTTKSLLSIFSSELTDIDGVGKQTNIFFTAIKELFDRCEKEVALTSMDLNSAVSIYYFFKYSVSLGKKENFAIVFLDTQNHLIGYDIATTKTVNSAVFPRELAEAALKYNAVNVVIIHNHPYSNLIPSEADIKMTHRIGDALATLDINLIDHIIISKKSYTSFSKLGLIYS